MTPSSELSDLPANICRYRVTGRIAAGSFGEVLRARDDDLNRDVAIKVPHAELLAAENALETFLAEARVLASLDHAGIMPVYDVGCTEDGLYFLVTKLVDGADLKGRLKVLRFLPAEAAEIAARVAEALHCAHRGGLVHRDVKPANILLDAEGQPILIDFGLALSAENVGKGPTLVGTVPYMSPEQSRREGHRVDARSDIYSLGVVLYEMLAGRRPFDHDDQAEMLHLIRTQEPPPLQMLDRTIPEELERICLKALAKRVSERYATALEMAEDLKYWLASQSAMAPAAVKTSTAKESSRTSAKKSGKHIVPRGLRSFGVRDAGFFLDLLPGPRDRDGLPDSIAFWKMRLESTDADQIFSVGVIYGPSGCGKSSLVKAGLLPQLAPHVLWMYIEATPDQTEAQLLKSLRRRCPDLPVNLGLVDTVALLRQGKGLRAGQKVVLVIDQFEQWLHAHRQDDDAELTQALRQCDGLHVMCVLMARDDFWLDVNRFMRAVEVPLEANNSGLIDLFDPMHARKVLWELGRAYGRLSEQHAASPELERFLDQAVAGLTEGGKVFPVRLSLFVEMFKGKSWTSKVLSDLGGAEGIGVLFLQDAFDSDSAPAQNRLHAQAARRVLQVLLPGPKTRLRDHTQSLDELLLASGYAHDAHAFAGLLQVLDHELRLVTPVTGERIDDTVSSTGGGSSGHLPNIHAKRYQLTHDFLVPSIRRWLTRTQRETRRGRAELCLAERADEWSLQKGTRFLPGWLEWAHILLWVPRSQWSPAQRAMMETANRYYAVRTGGWLLVFLVVGLVGAWIRWDIVEERKQAQALRLVESVANFHGGRLEQMRAQVKERPRAVPMLKDWIADPETHPNDRLHGRIVLLPFDSEQVQPLMEAMLAESVEEVLEIRDALEPYARELTPDLWRRFDDRQTEPGARLRAAAALAKFDPASKRWHDVAGPIVGELLEQKVSDLGDWLQAFLPVRQALLAPLMHTFVDANQPEKQTLAGEALARYANDQPDILADLILQANPAQYKQLWPVFEPHRATMITRLEREYQGTPPGDREAAHKRRAQALVTLLRLGHPAAVWPLLQHSSDPELRSFLIHLFSALGVDPQVLCARYEQENDVSARRALLLSIGTFELERIPADLRKTWIARLLASFRENPDPGLHAAAEWLLRRWGQDKELTRLGLELASRAPQEQRRWFINGQGHTLVILPAPGEITIGSPPQEVDRRPDETRHRVFLDRSFAVGAANVTWEQFQRFLKAHPEVRHNHISEYVPMPACPVTNVTWYQAAQYCRWLSEQEGVPEEQMCYPPVAEIKDGMKLPADILTRTGYRLPTEAEWEYACRAGADTSRCYGSGVTLLKHYAWYIANSEDHGWPVGMLKPNDFGLFGMHGNAWAWCQDRFVAQPDGKKQDADILSNAEARMMRGGSFRRRPFMVRSACRHHELPQAEDQGVGLRLARTWANPP